MSEFNQMLRKQDLMEMFDSCVEVPNICQQILDQTDFSYRVLQGTERDIQLLNQLKRIKADTQIVGTPDRTTVWQRGWSENLKEFSEGGYDVDLLCPKYFHDGIPLRLNQQFILTKNPKFEYYLQRCIKRYIFDLYLKNYMNIHEFGCGTGYNLADFASNYPEKNYYGYDFVPASVDLVEQIRKQYGFHLYGKLFNMKSPDSSVTLPPDSVVCTFACLEQLSQDTEAFLQYLLEQKPSLCVHLEPIVELYDDNNIVDWLAKEFHMKRHYLSGYYPRLLELEKSGKVKLEKVKRLYFGNLNHEFYTLLVWKPL